MTCQLPLPPNTCRTKCDTLFQGAATGGRSGGRGGFGGTGYLSCSGGDTSLDPADGTYKTLASENTWY